MVHDPSNVVVCSPQIFRTTHWSTTFHQYYGNRSVLYVHEPQQDGIDPNQIQFLPRFLPHIVSFLCMNETDPELILNVDTILSNSDEQWLVILGLQTERLRALYRFLIEKN